MPIGELGSVNLDRYKRDLDALIDKGERLFLAIQHECDPEHFARRAKGSWGDKAAEIIRALPSFTDEYQQWYSEAVVLIRQLLPDRLTDFAAYYEKARSRKNITVENYTIEDYLQGLNITSTLRGTTSTVVGPDAAIPRFRQQLAIVKSIPGRLQSSLFDIRQMAQADLFDSELDAAKELAKKGFTRAAGAVAGVVLEGHLKEVCGKHNVTIRKKNPHISDLNGALKKAEVIDTPQWRSMQHLADIRNLCDHDKESEPTADEVGDLIRGVEKTTKTLF